MGKTKIDWAEMVWNPAVGCTPAGVGCLNCYAKRVYERFHPGQSFSTVHLYLQKLTDPLKWKKPKTVFVDSMFDLFHERIDIGFVAQVFAIMAIAKQHTFVILTKRPERMLAALNDMGSLDKEVEAWQEQFCYEQGYCLQDFDWPLPNVWMLTSVSTQDDADRNIPALLRVPAAVRGVSVEPMLERIDFEPFLSGRGDGGMLLYQLKNKLDWVIAGCESGPGARDGATIDDYRNLRNQCVEAGVKFFLKQIRENGKIIKMPELDGKTWNEYPT